MDDRSTIAILLEFGFHDVKKYLHSGLAKKIAESFEIVWLAINKDNGEFDEYFKRTGFPLIYLNESDFSLPTLKIEKLNHKIRSSWMLNNKLGVFHNFKKVGKPNPITFLLGNSFLKYIFEKLTLSKVKSYYYSVLIDTIYNKYNVEYVLGIGYGSVYCRCAFVTANRRNLKTFFLIGSWKDLYLNNFIPFDFLNGIFVWSEQMKRDYIFNMPYLKEEAIAVTGNPTFDVLINGQPESARKYYSDKYKLPLTADWLLYTMMPPGLVNDEIETIKLVAKEILKKYTPEEISILVRRNPNHSAADIVDQKLPENMVIADHYCTYDKEKDIIIQSPEGEREWIDLLYHCSLNLSVPSTVTLEFKILNKPVLNIGFGPDGKSNNQLRQHFEAGFYRPLFNNKDIFKIMEIQSLFPILEIARKCSILKSDIINSSQSKLHLASDIIVHKLLEAR